MKKRELQEQLDAAHAEIARLVHIGDLRKREMQQLKAQTPDIISAAAKDEILGNLAAWGLRDGGPPDVLLDAATELAMRMHRTS